VTWAVAWWVAPRPAMDAAQGQVAGAAPLAFSRAQQTSPLLIPDVFGLVAGKLGPNERALLLRPLCKEALALLPDETTVHLSQPVPEAAFAAKWGQPGAPTSEKLLVVTATCGVAANVELLLAAGCPGRGGQPAGQLRLVRLRRCAAFWRTASETHRRIR
jgi:hypothetical protein